MRYIESFYIFYTILVQLLIVIVLVLFFNR